MRFKKYCISVFVILSFLGFCAILPIAKPIVDQTRVKYIIDAGHGFPDGGAVGTDGTTEQFLNLSVAQKTFDLFKSGTAIMVRSDENSLSTIDGSIREKKIDDMRKRVSFCNSYEDAMIISIHMNTFGNSSVYGCQVFYRKNDELSQKTAQDLQNAINDSIQPNHRKNAKPIADSLYLFQNTKNSAILIECGFLTNQQELFKLKDSDYQHKLAEIIYDSVKG